MATSIRVATFPFRVLWRLVPLLFLPGLITFVMWSFAGWGSPVFIWPALACLVWALLMVKLWWVQTCGELRSLARGTVHIRGSRRPRRGDR